MAKWPLLIGLGGGWTQGVSLTRYWTIIGDLDYHATEANVQILIRDTYTLNRLYVRVTANTLTAATTIRSRKNSANGNQIISVGAGATGVFQDVVNSDALVSGDLINTSVVTVAGGTSIRITLIGYVLVSATKKTFIIASCFPIGDAVTFGTTKYDSYMGVLAGNTTELNAQYTLRTPSVLSNLSVQVTSNSLDAAANYRLRINAGNGNQVISVGAGLTGRFEDAVNTDNVAAGSLVNYSISGVGSTVGFINQMVMQVKSTSMGQQIGEANASATFTLNSAATRWWPLQGQITQPSTVEANSQIAAQAYLRGKNLFVSIATNGMGGSTTFNTRKNGVNGNLSLSVPSVTTGVFEDTTNSESYTPTDLICYQGLGVGGGSLTVRMIGMEINQPQEPESKMPSKLVSDNAI